jgi:hypothetical protein
VAPQEQIGVIRFKECVNILKGEIIEWKKLNSGFFSPGGSVENDFLL